MTTTLKREMSLIPAWAMVVAVIVFVGIIAIFWTVVAHNRPSEPLRFIAIIPATFLAFLALMIGYVNRDAGRRGMSRTLWTLIVIFVPNAIGFIIYFLLRDPIRTNCPKCGTWVGPNVNYCPSCRYSFNPTCPQCKTAVRPGDTFCANCGVQL